MRVESFESGWKDLKFRVRGFRFQGGGVLKGKVLS
jgi:hypothetical protein